MTTAQAAVAETAKEKTELEINGFTSKVISELAGISISGAFRILDGQRMPGAGTLAKIAEVVGMTMDELHKELLSRQLAA